MIDKELSDNDVAKLLAADAKNRAVNYAQIGLRALLPNRNDTHAPKPNVRFLRNIIRETDSHNAALLAKEADESRAKLKGLEYQSKHDSSGSSRWRGDDEYRRSHKRRRVEEHWHKENDTGRRHSSQKHRSRSRERHRTKHRQHEDSYSDQALTGDSGSHFKHENRSKRRKRRDSEADAASFNGRGSHRHHKSRRPEMPRESDVENNPERSRSRSREHARKQYHRSKHSEDERSPSRTKQTRERNYHKHTRRHRRPRSHSPSTSRSESPSRSKRHRTISKRERRSKSPKREKRSRRRDQPDANSETTKHMSHSDTNHQSDSDPLDDIIGPQAPAVPVVAPVRKRGRGAFTSSGAMSMDTHFSKHYDPSADVEPEGVDDWEHALEVMRDRARWRQQGADRLRQAGFTEAQVRKWETGGEKTEEDVRWAKSGEGREWDRGKVVDDDGDVELRAEWGRLKGT